ncbi:GNAT family N-acetyltransferase [Bradyrhizobium sp.]|uniref:GNAT family N-acetyltransferase n=1 Tax=Bradyrhizobium sp. TaxID=376 RepID=UPI004037BAD2
MIASIEPLGKHERRAFSCGVAALDDWFHHRASQDEKRNVARVFVAIDEELGVVGFYSLSTFTLAIVDLPPEQARRLPRYDLIPAALIGRLARDRRVRGQGVGDLLLADAVRRILAAASTLAVFAIVVEAKDERAAAFYRDFGFLPFPNRPLRLFMPVADAIEAMSRAKSG